MLLKEKIKLVIESQRENLLRSEKGIEREVNAEPYNSFALIITGIRRSGKSTFLSQLIGKQNKWYYLNLEDPRLSAFESDDFIKVEEIMYDLYGAEGVFFFDEIQVVQHWEKFIRYLVDKKVKVVITGSNANMLSRELGTLLTGRHIQLEIFPFSYTEYLKILNQKESVESLQNYLWTGGFPEFVKLGNTDILHQLLTDIIYKDIVVRYGLKNVDTIKNLAIFLLSNVAKEFSYNAIKGFLQIKSVQSVIDYMEYLENAYITFTLPRFSYSYKQQIANPKKIYAIDNGLILANSTSFSKDSGRMLENIVFMELRKKYKQIYYYKEQIECDFVVKEKDIIAMAIQVCYEIHDENQNREFNGLIAALSQFNLDTGQIVTFEQDDELIIEGKTIQIVSLLKWIRNLPE
jgi:uncharacterized protein